MNKLSLNESKLCSYQARIFAESLSLNCSSKIFLRRFFNSDFANKMDNYIDYVFSYDTNDCFESLSLQFGNINYGKNKIDEDALYWLGYITRYICCTRRISSKTLYKTISLDILIKNYNVYHTQDEEWVISRINELFNIDLDSFNNDERIIKILKKIWL